MRRRLTQRRIGTTISEGEGRQAWILIVCASLSSSDARAVMERSIKANTDGSADTDSGKVYRGQAAYKSYITKKESQIGMNKYTGYVIKSDQLDRRML